MDENKKTELENEDENKNMTKAVEELTEEAAAQAEAAAEECCCCGTEEAPVRHGKKFKAALISACALVVVAAILLAVTGFGIITLLKGPETVEDIQGMEQGSFVKYKNFAILDFYGEETAGGQTTGLYAMVPMGSRLVTVHYTQRYVDSVKTICDETAQYVNGEIAGLDHYVYAQGTVGTLTNDEETLMYDWYAENKAAMVQSGVIADTEDAAEYLTEEVLLVDTVGGMDQTLVIVLSAAAAAMLLAAIVLFLLLLLGVFNEKAESEAEKHEGCSCCTEGEQDDGESAETDENGEAEAECSNSPEESVEKPENKEEKPEDNA